MRPDVRDQRADRGDRIAQLKGRMAELANPVPHLGCCVNVDAARIGRSAQSAISWVAGARRRNSRHRNTAAAAMATITRAGTTTGGTNQAHVECCFRLDDTRHV